MPNLCGLLASSAVLMASAFGIPSGCVGSMYSSSESRCKLLIPRKDDGAYEPAKLDAIQKDVKDDPPTR